MILIAYFFAIYTVIKRGKEKILMLLKCFILVVLFLIAIATVHVISWVGSVLHSVPYSGYKYAILNFRTDQGKSMSTNIFMNIVIPNIGYIFIYMWFYYADMNVGMKISILFVVFYYLYRCILICFILKRRELFSFRYEIFNCSIGIMLSIFLTSTFLQNPTDVFIELKDLASEFWLVVIVVIYKFSVLLLDKAFSQENVVNKGMLERYVKNRFDLFYEKYKAEVYITKEDNIVWLLLFAIMIFENYNRGGIIRKLEKIKLFLGRSTTAGIMQVTSSVYISDEESIKLAYDKLRKEIIPVDCRADDEAQIKYYAKQYNNDDSYAESVSFIYQVLKKYILGKRSLMEEFYFINKEDDTYKVNRTDTEEYLTISDIECISGLSKTEIEKKIREENVTIYVSNKAVNEIFMDSSEVTSTEDE